jgi:hypothetical protein
MKNPFAVQSPILVSIGVETNAVLQTKGRVIYACVEQEMAMNRTARNLATVVLPAETRLPNSV